ncbi:MAG TPA: hypothetical protein VFO39_07670 [Candidatus Sulfotelmatobacter sp.]|nr:hypothetical protein [Candidatus Sulfotelmatobacter sp.]
MPRIPIFRLGGSQRPAPTLISSTPVVLLRGLMVGVDNLRHDVVLSAKVCEAARAHLARVIARHGELEGLLSSEPQRLQQAPSWLREKAGATPRAAEPSDLKKLLAELLVATLNRAKRDGMLGIDILARLALTKFLRQEMNAQFAQVLERGRVMFKSVDAMRQQNNIEQRERLAAFQVRKKIILRKVGQDLFQTFREVEKESLARTRRSLFGEESDDGSYQSYPVFLNRLAFGEDGRDDYLCAEHYVMLGNWDRDPDRYGRMREIVAAFLRSIYGEETAAETVDSWMNVPENAATLVGTGTPDDSSEDGIMQQERLAAWVRLLEDEKVMENVIASYHVVPLLSEYAPRINPQQLKNALIERAECDRVERMIQEHGRLSPNSLYGAVAKVASCRGAERAKVAARFLQDFLRYHRDLRRLETLNSALDSVNLAGNERVRELSRVNGTLYEFLLPEEQQESSADRILRHVVMKADVRDSTRLTRTMMDKGMNPASYFSLNFYDPVNKLLGKYGAQKVFLEGDAIILAILEREGETGLAVSRACVLAREMIEIVRGYNELVQRSGLPPLELGVGITLQESAPLYLMDGERQIMISEALNESDRLSGCNKKARKLMESQAGLFHVYAFQSGEPEPGGNPEDSILNFNLGGIRMNETAFKKLQQEISLQPLSVKLPKSLSSSDKAEYKLLAGMVPVDRDIFRKIVVRESRVPRVDAKDFSVKGWTDRRYYEVCTDPAIYAALEKSRGAGR